MSTAVARIDAIQAEYSPFETLHDEDGLVETARELDITFISYGPLGHGWLVDDFPYKSPDDFALDDYRRQSKLASPPSQLIYDPMSSDPGLIALPRLLVPKFQGQNFYDNKEISNGFKDLARRKGCSLAQVAIAWVTAQGMIPIPGTTKPSRLEENWASRDIDLTEEDLKEMRQLIQRLKPHGSRYNEQAMKNVGI
jgi:aryl-alcohol dehydrogenase-like predicted oxidoreductase